jgi:hypothetical protein
MATAHGATIRNITIRVYANDHLPPHFHIVAPDFEALVEMLIPGTATCQSAESPSMIALPRGAITPFGPSVGNGTLVTMLMRASQK